MRRFTQILAVSSLVFAGLAPAALAQTADLVVSKTGPAIVSAGSNVSYDVFVMNVGPDDASTVVLADPIPQGMTFVSATQNSGVAFTCTTPAVGTAGTVSCSTATLIKNTSASFTFVFNISIGVGPGTFFTNVASISSATFDPTGENDTSTAVTQTPPPPQSDLFISKNGPGSAGPGTSVTYTITTGNAGPDTATSVSLQDTLPGNMTFGSLTQNSGPAFSCTTPAANTGGTVTCSIASFGAGASATFTLVTQIPIASPSGTSYANTATISSATADPNAENNSSGAVTVVSTADVAATKTAPATAVAGTPISYVITATNNGPDGAQNVVLQDVLPAGVSFVSATQNSGPAGGCSQSINGAITTVFCSVSVMNAATAAQFTIVGAISPGATGTLTNTVTVTTDSFDPATANNSATASTLLTTSADLAVIKTAPATATAGSTISYSISLADSGPSAAASATLTDVLPANTTFVSLTAAPGFSCIAPSIGASGTVSCTAVTLNVGALATFTLVVRLNPATPAGTSIANTATASSATSDPNPGNNTSTSTTNTTVSADLGVVKTGPASASAGSNITYTITATNNGASTATTVSLTDTLPANTTFVSESQTSGPAFTCTPPAVGSTGTLTCTATTLAPGTSAGFSVVVKLVSTATGTVSNTVTISGTSPDGVPANNSSTSTATVTQSADLAVTKNGSATVTSGNNITYSVTLTNNGPSDATTVSLTDAVPANTTFVSAAPTSGPASGPAFSCATPVVGGTGTIVCSAPSLLSGGSVVFTIVVKSSSGANGIVISNTASATSATPDPAPANNSSTFTTSAGAVADLSIVKTASATGVAGSNLTYTVTVTNGGPSDAASVSVSDVLPATATFVSATQTSGPAFICTTPAAGATGTVACTAATLVPGASATFSLVVKPSPSSSAALTNTATVTAASTDPVPANNSSSATTTISSSADLAVAKTGPASAGAGSDIVYTVTLTNLGPSDATTVTLTDITPANAGFVSATQTSGPAFTCTTPAAGTSGTVACTASSLAAGKVATFNIVEHLSTNLAAGTTVTNTVSVSSATPDPNSANNTATVSTTSSAAIPTLSALTLALLAVALGAVAIVALRGN